jgi:hypothetical protein
VRFNEVRAPEDDGNEAGDESETSDRWAVPPASDREENPEDNPESCFDQVAVPFQIHFPIPGSICEHHS